MRDGCLTVRESRPARPGWVSDTAGQVVRTRRKVSREDVHSRVTEVNVDAMNGKVIDAHHETSRAEAAEKKQRTVICKHAPGNMRDDFDTIIGGLRRLRQDIAEGLREGARARMNQR